MGIPYYRYVSYQDDGHSLWQCLMCKEQISAPSLHGWRYCPYCAQLWHGEMKWDQDAKWDRQSRSQVDVRKWQIDRVYSHIEDNIVSRQCSNTTWQTDDAKYIHRQWKQCVHDVVTEEYVIHNGPMQLRLTVEGKVILLHTYHRLNRRWVRV